jgi:hypothetical protein
MHLAKQKKPGIVLLAPGFLICLPPFSPLPIEKVAESQFSEELSNPLVVYSTHPDLFVNLFFKTIK